MYTLKGLFPDPKKEPKKNFIKENMKQLKYIQGKVTEPKYALKAVLPPRLTQNASFSQVKSSPSNKSGKVSLSVGKSYSNNRKNAQNIRIKKGDMAEFLKRKETRHSNEEEPQSDAEEKSEEESSGRVRDIGCQTNESTVKGEAKLTMLYPLKHEDSDVKKASGDRTMMSPHRHITPRKTGGSGFFDTDSGDKARPNPLSPHRHLSRDSGLLETEKRSRLNAILERKDTKDPYLPSGYQKGVVPKYIRERKEQLPKETEGAKADEAHAVCPPGHVTLPDSERKETLRMLRNSFAELVNELNKMPVKTDTLRMRNRKSELEKQLAKLEEGIKVFSRPKVFVKIGE